MHVTIQYLHWIHELFTLHEGIFYDAVQLFFEVQKILYHALILFRIQDNASTLFLKQKEKQAWGYLLNTQDTFGDLFL